MERSTPSGTAELIDYYRDALLKMPPEDFVVYLRQGLELRLPPGAGSEHGGGGRMRRAPILVPPPRFPWHAHSRGSVTVTAGRGQRNVTAELRLWHFPEPENCYPTPHSAFHPGG